VTPGPKVEIVWPVSGGFFLANTPIDLAATATQDNGTITSVIFVDNEFNPLASISTPPYAYRWTGATAGTHVITARVNGSGGQTISVPVTITVGSTPSVTPTTTSGTVNDDTALVQGTVQAPPNSTVLVNGAPATVSHDGQFFINELELQAGSNNVSIQVITPDGVTSTQNIVLNSTGPAAFHLDADPLEGFGPLTVTFRPTATGATAFASIDFDFESDGVVDYTLTSLDGDPTFSIVYPGPGVYRAKMTVKDAQQSVIFTTTKVIHVYTPVQRFSMARDIYLTMTERLASGNIEGAVAMIGEGQRDQFRALFTDLGTGLANTVASLGTIEGGRVFGNTMELFISRGTVDGPIAFIINFSKDGSGVWRIESM
jgi:Glucodextranase, domain B/Bacterial Ig domain